MAITGIGAGVGLNVLPSRQDLAPASERSNLPSSRQTEPSSSDNVSGQDTSQLNISGARFAALPAGNQPNPNSQERRNPADIEAIRNQFGLQSENSPTSPNRAISSFVAVAQFEQRDELSSTTGIDIFV